MNGRSNLIRELLQSVPFDKFQFRHFGIIKLPNTYMPHRYTKISPIWEYKVKRPFVTTCAAKVFVSD